jgi:hypothetical protein
MMKFGLIRRWRQVLATVLLAAPFGIDAQSHGESPDNASGQTDAKLEEEGFSPLFDGKSLRGWEGDENVFRVEDGAIVGGTLEKPVPHNFFLCTEKEYGDFELRLEFKLVGEGTNAGVQLRSARIPNHHEVQGYQADLGDGYWGCLYDESRRNRVLTGPEQEDMKSVVRLGEWNDYRILCEGKRIRLWINGTPTVDYTEEDANIAEMGLIAVQIHGGPPGEAWYRHIRLREL